MSQRGYAKHRGVAMSTVQKAIQSGRIVVDKDGKIGSEAADAQWKSNTRQHHPRATIAEMPAEQTGFGGSDYSKARAVRETYQARLAKLDYDEKVGKLVNGDEVRMAAFAMARSVRDNLMNIPDRLAATIAAESDGELVHQILTGEIRKVLDELASGVV